MGTGSSNLSTKRSVFGSFTVAHPELVQAKERLLAAVRDSASNSLILVVGPTGVGKTTLLNRTEQILTEELLPDLEADRGRIAVARVEAVAPDSGNFSWRDHFKRLLFQLEEPLVQYKRSPQNSQNRNFEARSTLNLKTPASEYRYAVEQALRYRRPAAVLIDEAQHLARMTSGRKLLDQLEVIKSVASQTGTVHVLCGTYEVLAFRNLSGQLSRRSIDVHFRRYRAEEAHDRRTFLAILRSFQQQLPPETADLTAEWEYLYEGSLGCVGILKDWLSRALLAVSRRGEQVISRRDLGAHALSISQREKMLSEILEGEAQLRDTRQGRARLRVHLGLDGTGDRASEVASPKHQRRTPGHRLPGRDEIGHKGEQMFASWKLSLPQVPQRTRLYPLEPVGVGTAMVESMTGYVMRLAEAHAVPVGALINHELAQRKASTERHSTRAYCSLPYYANGSNQCAAGWVQALEAETYRTNLSLLTFLPLGESFCTRYIFRGVRAWCPACYEQWRTFDRTIYEPLLWSVRLVAVCSRHQRALVETCPHCQRSMKPVGSTSRTGYCDNCHRWLGVGNRHHGIAGEETSGRRLTDSALWLTRGVEELISLMPRLATASLRTALSVNLRSCIDHVFGGYAAGLARFTSSGASVLDYWLSGWFAPKLDQFLLFAERLRIPVAAFLLDDGSQSLGDWRPLTPEPGRYVKTEVRYRSGHETRRALEVALRDHSAPSLAEVARRLNYRGTTGLRRVSRHLCKRITQKYQEFFTPAPYHKGPRPRRCEPAKVRTALLQSLAQKDPESVPSIARGLGYVSSAPILEKFPLLCRLIHRKTIRLRQTRIRRMRNLIRMALRREDPITLHQLANRLGFKDKKIIQRYFPTFHAQLLAHRRACKQKRLTELKRQLQHWNRAAPPISLTKVCQELALSRSTVARKCPQECRAITLRHAQSRVRPLPPTT